MRNSRMSIFIARRLTSRDTGCTTLSMNTEIELKGARVTGTYQDLCMDFVVDGQTVTRKINRERAQKTVRFYFRKDKNGAWKSSGVSLLSSPPEHAGEAHVDLDCAPIFSEARELWVKPAARRPSMRHRF